MRKYFQKSFLSAAVVLCLSCCASLPAPHSPDDCLVVVKTDFIRNQQISYEEQTARSYRYVFTGDYEPITIGVNYTLIPVTEPAVSVKSIESWVNSPFTGPSGADEVNVALPYKPGCIVVADFVFVRKTVKTGSRAFTSSIDLRKITERERWDLLQRFKADHAFAGWNF